MMLVQQFYALQLVAMLCIW